MPNPHFTVVTNNTSFLFILFTFAGAGGGEYNDCRAACTEERGETGWFVTITPVVVQSSPLQPLSTSQRVNSHPWKCSLVVLAPHMQDSCSQTISLHESPLLPSPLPPLPPPLSSPSSPLLPPPPQDPKRHLEEKVDAVLTANITQSLVAMLDTVVFS